MDVGQDLPRTIAILDSFEEGTTIREEIGAWSLAKLSVNFFKLEMYDEAAPTAFWASNLYRSLWETDHRRYRRNLALSLLNLARLEFKISNITEANDAAGDCVKVCEEWMQDGGGREAKYFLARAYTTASLPQTSVPDHLVARDYALRSVKLFEELLEEIGKIDEAASIIATDISSSPSAADVIASPLSPNQQHIQGVHRLIHDYGRALHQLSYCHHDLANYSEASEKERQALEQFMKVRTLFPMSHLEFIAEAHYHLIQSVMRIALEPEDLLHHGREATTLYRFLGNRARLQGLNYYNSLWEYAMVLGNQGKYEQALTMWEELSVVAQDIMLDPLYLGDAYRQLGWTLRRLKRHEEAARCRRKSVDIYHEWLKPTSYHEADGLHDLSVELHIAGYLQEALVTQVEAVTYYRRLTSSPDGEQLAHIEKKLGDAVTHLGFCYFTINDINQALIYGREALEMFKALMPKMEEENYTESFVYTLRVVINAAFQSDDEEASLALSEECMLYFEELFKLSPDKGREPLSHGYSTHGFKLNKHNRALEAIDWTEKSLKWYEQQPLDKDITVTDTYIATLINLADDLSNMGRLKEALTRIEQAITVGEKYCKDQPTSVPFVSCALHNLPEIYLDYGRYDEALDASEKAVVYAQNHPMEDMTQLSGALMVKASVMARLGRYDEALVVAKESMKVCVEAPMDKIAKSNMFAPLQLARCFRGLAELRGDMGFEEDALKLAQEGCEKALAIRANREYTLPVAFTDVVYGYCRYTCAEMMAANGMLDEAVESLFSQAEVLRGSLALKPGNYPRLAPVLRLLGMVLCAVGRHDEAVEVYGELQKMRNGLKGPLPEVCDLVEIELEKEMKRPHGISLARKLDTGCGHKVLPKN